MASWTNADLSYWIERMSRQLPLTNLLDLIAECRLCEAQLGHVPRPVIRASETARILIIGQAPGTRVHASGVPWDDASGERLRSWLALDRATFYDPRQIAIMPMGLCYPGKGKSGDLPPRPECAPLWHGSVLEQLPNLQLVLLIGRYAQQYYLDTKSLNLTATVLRWQEFGPYYWPLVHPSPRNQIWLKRNPWFESTLIPRLRTRVKQILKAAG